MPRVTYEIKFKPVDESTLEVPKKKIGGFFQEKTLPSIWTRTTHRASTGAG
jgi:hypothetical protein